MLRIAALPDDPLAAAAVFHADWLPKIKAMPGPSRGGEDIGLTLVFPPADHTHRGWRLALIQSLARACAPLRINAVASDDESAIAAAIRYLDTAPGVTGQYWPLDGTGASEVLS